MKGYYNLSLLKRMYVEGSQLSDRWIHYSSKSSGMIDWLFNNRLYTLNRKGDVYRKSRYYFTSGKIPYYTVDNINEQLDSSEYLDANTNEIMTYPKAVLAWVDGSKTEIYFKSEAEANNYVEILNKKYNNLGKTFITINNN